MEEQKSTVKPVTPVTPVTAAKEAAPATQPATPTPATTEVKPAAPVTPAAPVKPAATTTQTAPATTEVKPAAPAATTPEKPAPAPVAPASTPAPVTPAPAAKEPETTPVKPAAPVAPVTAEPEKKEEAKPEVQTTVVKPATVQPVQAQTTEPAKKEETPAPVAPAPAEEPKKEEAPEALLVGNVAPTVQTVEVREELDTREEEAQAKINAEEKTIKQTEPNAKKEVKIKNPNAFNSDEKVLFKQKKQKESNPIIVLLVLAVLIVFAIFLPNISKYVYTLLNPSVTFAPVVQTPEAEEEGLKTDFRDFESGNLTLELNDLEFTNFVKTNTEDVYDITFTVINKADEVYLYGDHLYISFYSEKNQVLFQGMIYSYEPLASNGSVELSVVLNKNAYDNGTKFRIEQINPHDYPNARIEKQEEDYKILTCFYNNDVIEYYFKDSLLNIIKEKYTEDVATSYDYEGRKSKKYEEYLLLKEVAGIKSDFVESPTDFTIITEINLGATEFQELQGLKKYKYFKNNANANVVSFEIRSLGYTCS